MRSDFDVFDSDAEAGLARGKQIRFSLRHNDALSDILVVSCFCHSEWGFTGGIFVETELGAQTQIDAESYNGKSSVSDVGRIIVGCNVGERGAYF
jgi:hypothetical protein